MADPKEDDDYWVTVEKFDDDAAPKSSKSGKFSRSTKSGAGRDALPKSRFGFRDLTSESVAGMVARPARTALTALGTVLGVAALVATLGLAKTAGSQIVSRFDELSATQVVIEPASRQGSQSQASTIPWDTDARLERLNGVVAAGTKSDVNVNGALVRSVPVVDPLGANEFPGHRHRRITWPVRRGSR